MTMATVMVRLALDQSNQARHGIAAQRIGGVKREGGTSAALDQITASVGAGLIVAGAYGHSRFRARCVLLSH